MECSIRVFSTPLFDHINKPILLSEIASIQYTGDIGSGCYIRFTTHANKVVEWGYKSTQVKYYKHDREYVKKAFKIHTNKNKHTSCIDLRPDVMRFAMAMEMKLRENEGKGGYDACNNSYLEHRLYEEYGELLKADTPAGKCGESVDVANFAMMIFSNNREK